MTESVFSIKTDLSRKKYVIVILFKIPNIEIILKSWGNFNLLMCVLKKKKSFVGFFYKKNLVYDFMYQQERYISKK